MVNTERKNYIDFLKVLACFCVVLLHVSGSKWGDIDVHSGWWQILNTFNASMCWTIPLFVMAIGAIFLSPGKITSYSTVFKKYIFKIVVAILLFGILIFLTKFVPQFIESGNTDILYQAQRLWESCNWYHLWYLYMIIGMYLIIPVMQQVTQHISRRQLEIFMLILFVLCHVYPFCRGFIPVLGTFYYHSISFPIVSDYLLYLLLGYYFDQYVLTQKANRLIYFLGIIGWLSTIAGTSIISWCNNEAYRILLGYNTPNVFLMSIAIFVWFRNNYQNLTLITQNQKTVFSLSKLTLAIYGVHDIFIILLGKFGVTVISHNPIFMIPFIYVVVLVAAICLAWLLCQIPVFKKILT